MSRSYLVFGSDDGVNWELLNTVQANGAEQALKAGLEQESHRHYGATPERNWSAMTPEVVERAPVVKWKPLNPTAQMTVDEVIEEPSVEKHDKQEVIREAKQALASKPGQTLGAEVE